jgi:hypothetical protein
MRFNQRFLRNPKVRERGVKMVRNVKRLKGNKVTRLQGYKVTRWIRESPEPEFEKGNVRESAVKRCLHEFNSASDFSPL